MQQQGPPELELAPNLASRWSYKVESLRHFSESARERGSEREHPVYYHSTSTLTSTSNLDLSLALDIA